MFASMLLAIDIGNTNTVLGLFDGERILRRFRVRTLKERTADETGVLFLNLFQSAGLPAEVDDTIVASVVPDALQPIADCCRSWFHSEPLVVGAGLRTGMPILVDNPREVGADRIVNAVAAYEQVGGACVVVDFGTATTLDCISARGEYVGGVIAPGYRISADALFQRASKLPRVEFAQPRRVIGRNTIHSMQSGLFHGYVSLVDGLIERVCGEYPPREQPAVLATGGLAPALVDASRGIERAAPDLTLEGLRLLYDRNC